MCTDAVIQNIIKLGNGSDTQQWTATQQMCAKIFPGGKCVDPSVIPQILPTIIKFMNSKDPAIQSEGVFFATAITTTIKQNTKLLIDAGALPILVDLLLIDDFGLQEMTLRCLGNIAIDFPTSIIIDPIIIKHAESKNNKVCEEALKIMTTLIFKNSNLCQRIPELDALKAIKKAFSRLPSIKLLAIDFLKKVRECGQVDTIIEENLIPIILKQVNAGGKDDEIKLKCAEFINEILAEKPQIIPSLINEYKIIPIVTSTLYSDNKDMLIAVLSILNSIIDYAGFESIAHKFKNYGRPRALRKLLEHDKNKIQELSNKIYSYFDDENGDVEVENSGRSKHHTRTFTPPPCASSRNQRRSKRSAATVTPQKSNLRSKRARRSLDQTDTEQSGSNADDNEEENYDERIVFNDFDDLPSRHSSPIELYQRQPIVMFLPPISPNNSRIEEEAAIEGNENNEIETNAFNDFPSIKYYIPPECFISKYCEKLGLNFNRKEYVNLWSKIEFSQISSNSKPSKFLSMKDKSGYSCFSVFFATTEKHAELMWEKLNGNFVDNLERLDREKIKKVIISRSFMPEHLDAIVQMFQCRIMVYCNGRWQRYGDWNIQSDDIPLFVLQKKEVGNKTIYEIILSLKD